MDIGRFYRLKFLCVLYRYAVTRRSREPYEHTFILESCSLEFARQFVSGSNTAPTNLI